MIDFASDNKIKEKRFKLQKLVGTNEGRSLLRASRF